MRPVRAAAAATVPRPVESPRPDAAGPDLERDLQLAREIAERVVRERAARGRDERTLAAAVEAYLPAVAHLASYGSRRAELRAWLTALGPATRLADIAAGDVRLVRAVWLDAGVAPATCNHRTVALHHLFTTLGLANSPVRGLRRLPVPRTVPVVVPVEVVAEVDARLAAAFRSGRLPDERARARLAVAASTGRRPSEIMRAQPDDIDWRRRVWRVRDGKGGFTPGGLYLADAALQAWRLFAAVDAWGRFAEASWVRTLRRTGGWPDRYRPYQLRHSAGIAMSEAGVDLADVGAALGHQNTDMTRSHYVPVLNSRMQAAAEALDRARPMTFVEADESSGQLPLPLLGAVGGKER